jgi:ABC-type transporter Mla MlaB component
MSNSSTALAIRPGEHACCRFARATDRERLGAAFVRDGLTRGHRVVYLCDRAGPDEIASRLAALDDRVEAAHARGQLHLRGARDAYMPDGAFEMERMLRWIRAEHAQALADGYAGLSLTGELSWSLCGAPSCPELLSEYERRVDDVMHDGTLVILCQYDHRGFAPGTLSEVAAAHAVDMSPELAAIGRDGDLAAARVQSEETLRFSGALDYVCADAVAGVLDAHYHGDLRLDLADVGFADVSGMRALRGRKGQALTINGASESVRRLLALLAWDTDPRVEVDA